LLGAGVFVHNTQALNNFGHSLWVKESGVWTKKTSGISTVEETLTATYTTNIANIISSGHLHVGAQSDYTRPATGAVSAINTYYLSVVVTYTANSAPNAPSSLGAASYVNGSTVTDTSPTLQFTQSDWDAGNTLKFQIQIDNTSNFSSPEVDYTSALIAQGATSFTVAQAAGSGSYTAGGQDIDLNNYNPYYWRVRSNDNALWGNWATANGGLGAFALVNTTYTTVNSTADTSTLGTLRFALKNVTAGQTITFDITVFPSGTPATISPTSALPPLTGNITINATSRGVIINGSGVVTNDGLTLWNAGNSVINLQIKSYINNGITITGNSNTVQNCQIYSNTAAGIQIAGTSASNTIQSNTIYSNGTDGIHYTSTGATSAIKGNYIGTNSAWSTTIGNTGDGIEINQTSGNVTIGGTGAGDGNWLCKNAMGIRITDGTVNIYGNYIGTNSSGATNIGNTTSGIYAASGADAVTIGSSASTDKNVIGSNGSDGIDMYQTSWTGTIKANYIGTDSSWRNLKNGTTIYDGGIYINGVGGTVIIGGALASDRNFIAFNYFGIRANNGTVTIKGNYIGTNTAATPANLGNTLGIDITGGTTTVGSTTSGEQNVIGYNTNGINVIVSAATIAGNYIGMNSSYVSAPNADYGIYVNTALITPTIGGTVAGSANYIGFHSGVGDAGIYVNDGSPTIKGNYIGTNASGTNLANTNGIALAAGADAVTIGGTASGAGNVISLNAADGLNTASTNTSIVVQGNFIGTDTAGTASWPNGGDGIKSTAGTITIGNASEVVSNVIGPNTGYGINLASGTPTITLAGTVDVNDDVNFAVGTLNMGSANLKLFGNWTNAGTTQNASFSTLTLDGTANQTITTNAKTFWNVTLNNAGVVGSDKIIISGALDIDGTLTLTNGNLDLSTNNPNLTLTMDLVINNTADPAITRGSGTWTFDGGSESYVSDYTAGIDLGNIVLNKTAGGPDASTYNILDLGSNVKMTSINIDGTAGSYDTLNLGFSGYTLTLTGNGTPLTIGTNAVFNAGTNSTLKFAPAGTTGVTVPAKTYHNIEFNKALNTFTLGGNIVANGNLTITAGTLDATVSNYGITVGGSWTNSGTFTKQLGMVTFNGSTTPVTLNPGASTFYNLTISKAAAANLVTLSTNSIDIGNALNITTGTLDLSGAAALNITTRNTVTIGANGRFSKGTGTFYFYQGGETYTDSSSNGPQNLGIVRIG